MLILAFMVAEVTAGILASSLALLSDAAHMLTDAAALGLSLAAAHLAARPAHGAMTYGLGRAEILSAQANGITLLILGLLIVYEAIVRLVSPPHVDGGAGPGRRARRDRGQPARREDPDPAGWPAQPQRRGLLPPHPDGPLRLHRDGRGRRRDPRHGLLPCRSDRVVADRVADAARLLRTAQGVGTGVHGGSAGRTRSRSRSVTRSLPSRASSRSMTCMCGRSPRVFRPSRRTSWSGPGTTATSAGADLQQLLEEQFDVHHTTLQVDHEAAPQAPLQIEVPAIDSPHEGGQAGRRP